MAPFVFYADFECITVPLKDTHGKQTVGYQEHKACDYGYKIVCQYDDKYSKYSIVNKVNHTKVIEEKMLFIN